MIVTLEIVGVVKGDASESNSELSASIALSPSDEDCLINTYCALPVQPNDQSSESSPMFVSTKWLMLAVPPKNSTPSSRFS